MEDRELLEMAAKAAGGIEYDQFKKIFRHLLPMGFLGEEWNPLDDDGDAFRLAIKLSICIQFIPDCDTVQVYQERDDGEAFNVHVAGLGDIETRRIITKAAAEIGKSMP